MNLLLVWIGNLLGTALVAAGAILLWPIHWGAVAGFVVVSAIISVLIARLTGLLDDDRAPVGSPWRDFNKHIIWWYSTGQSEGRYLSPHNPKCRKDHGAPQRFLVFSEDFKDSAKARQLLLIGYREMHIDNFTFAGAWHTLDGILGVDTVESGVYILHYFGDDTAPRAIIDKEACIFEDDYPDELLVTLTGPFPESDAP